MSAPGAGCSISRDQLADRLTRRKRLGELRAYAALDGHEEAVRRLVALLEEAGDVEGAIAVYGQAGGPAPHDPNAAYDVARSMARHGRGTEAIAVMRGRAGVHPGDDWILHASSELCLDQDRPADGPARLDARLGGEGEWELFWMRIPLIAACGGVDEAVNRLRLTPKVLLGTRRSTPLGSSPAPGVPRKPSPSCSSMAPEQPRPGRLPHRPRPCRRSPGRSSAAPVPAVRRAGGIPGCGGSAGLRPRRV